jgi:serine/threonine-protein kinase
MAPELVKGDLARTDARTDVYLLGATLHAVLTGSPRHAASSVYEALLLANASEPYVYRSDVPAELAAICNRATSREPADRFQSALDLRRAVADFRRHRGSIALSDEAAARLSELGARTRAAAPDDDIQVRRLMTECRFGFVQALRIWAANDAARAGLQACLERMIEHEIARQDADGARALCAELPEARPELVRRIDDLAAELARRKAQLGALERDQDLRIGGAAQLAIVGVLPAFTVGAAMILLGLGRAPTPAVILGGPALVFLIHATGAILARRRLSTAISRRAIGALALIPACGFVHRVIALELGNPLPAILATDLVMAAFMLGVLAITLVPWLGWAVLPFGVGAIGAAIRPDLALPIFMASLTSGMGLVAVLWRRAVRS